MYKGLICHVKRRPFARNEPIWVAIAAFQFESDDMSYDFDTRYITFVRYINNCFESVAKVHSRLAVY